MRRTTVAGNIGDHESLRKAWRNNPHGLSGIEEAIAGGRATKSQHIHSIGNDTAQSEAIVQRNPREL